MANQTWQNKLYYGDNLEVMQESIPSASVDLVYLDPPFNSNRNYNVIFAEQSHSDGAAAQIQAFGDTWHWTPVTEQQYQPSKGVLDAIDHGGIYQWPANNMTFPRFQIITIDELLRGVRLKTPLLKLPYVQASRASTPQTMVQGMFTDAD